MNTPPRPGPAEAGFTLIEMLVAVAITLLVTGGALSAFLHAKSVNEVSNETLSVNREIQAALDFIVRDVQQTAQGLPNTKVLTIPSGNGVVVNRPGPASSSLTFATGATEWPAVVPGAGLGPQTPTGSSVTDVFTIAYADTQYLTSAGEPPTATVAGDCLSMTVTAPVGLEVGDVVMFVVNGSDAMQTVTAVTGAPGSTQTVRFDTGDKLALNQAGAAAGRLLDIQPTASTAFSADVSRIRFVTYYVDTSRTPAALIRCLSSQCVGNPKAAGQVLALGVENFQITYDLVDGVTNPANVEMNATDQAGGGGCGVNPCSVNQIRKMNIALSMRSRHAVHATSDFVHRTLRTQVSLRNLSFLDRYPTS